MMICSETKGQKKGEKTISNWKTEYESRHGRASHKSRSKSSRLVSPIVASIYKIAPISMHKWNMLEGWNMLEQMGPDWNLESCRPIQIHSININWIHFDALLLWQNNWSTFVLQRRPIEPRLWKHDPMRWSNLLAFVSSPMPKEQVENAHSEPTFLSLFLFSSFFIYSGLFSYSLSFHLFSIPLFISDAMSGFLYPWAVALHQWWCLRKKRVISYVTLCHSSSKSSVLRSLEMTELRASASHFFLAIGLVHCQMNGSNKICIHVHSSSFMYVSCYVPMTCFIVYVSLYVSLWHVSLCPVRKCSEVRLSNPSCFSTMNLHIRVLGNSRSKVLSLHREEMIKNGKKCRCLRKRLRKRLMLSTELDLSSDTFDAETCARGIKG